MPTGLLLWGKIMFNTYARQVVKLAKLCAFGLLFYTIYRLFSPWKIIIEIRSVSDSSNANPSPDAGVVTSQDAIQAEVQEQTQLKKDDIEKNFGPLEESFIKSIRDPSSPNRSRDESIKLIYDVQSPKDWLDLVDGHDDHVSIPLFSCFELRV